MSGPVFRILSQGSDLTFCHGAYKKRRTCELQGVPMRSLPLRPRLFVGVFLVLGLLLALSPAPVSAQAAAPAPVKKAMTVDDYPLWRSISAQALSPDGKWLAYVLELTNVPQAETKPVLHIVDLGAGKDVTVNDATSPVFSPDSRWLAYQVDPGAAQRAR